MNYKKQRQRKNERKQWKAVRYEKEENKWRKRVWKANSMKKRQRNEEKLRVSERIG